MNRFLVDPVDDESCREQEHAEDPAERDQHERVLHLLLGWRVVELALRGVNFLLNETKKDKTTCIK